VWTEDFVKSVDLNERGLELIFVACNGKCNRLGGLQDRPARGKDHSPSWKEAGCAVRDGFRRPSGGATRWRLNWLRRRRANACRRTGEFVRGVKAKGYRCGWSATCERRAALAAGDIGIGWARRGAKWRHSATIELMNNDLRRLPFLGETFAHRPAVINQNFMFGVVFIIVRWTVTCQVNWPDRPPPFCTLSVR